MNDNFDSKHAIDGINNTLNSSDKFGNLIEKTLRESKIADKAIKKIVIDLLKDDKSCRQEIQKIIKECDRDEYKIFLKNTGHSIGTGVWTLIVIFVTAIVTKFFK